MRIDIQDDPVNYGDVFLFNTKNEIANTSLKLTDCRDPKIKVRLK
jgi:hypothetical protein